MAYAAQNLLKLPILHLSGKTIGTISDNSERQNFLTPFTHITKQRSHFLSSFEKNPSELNKVSSFSSKFQQEEEEQAPLL